jgi:4-hydroxy-tetrahydrodipicolinate synthase
MADAVMDRDLATGRRLFYCLLPLIDRLFLEPNPGPIKAALARMELIGEELRPPMQPASAGLRSALAVELERLKKVPVM